LGENEKSRRSLKGKNSCSSRSWDVMNETPSRDFELIYTEVRNIIEHARGNVYKSINFNMALAYWGIGKIIVEEEQKGSNRAEYGISLIETLAERLTNEFGKGFNKSNLKYMR
jgi:hypothetical protein